MDAIEIKFRNNYLIFLDLLKACDLLAAVLHQTWGIEEKEKHYILKFFQLYNSSLKSSPSFHSSAPPSLFLPPPFLYPFISVCLSIYLFHISPLPSLFLSPTSAFSLISSFNYSSLCSSLRFSLSSSLRSSLLLALHVCLAILFTLNLPSSLSSSLPSSLPFFFFLSPFISSFLFSQFLSSSLLSSPIPLSLHMSHIIFSSLPNPLSQSFSFLPSTLPFSNS